MTPRGKRLEAGALRANAHQMLDKAGQLEREANAETPEAIRAAAQAALDYLRNALSEEFARGSDKAVRDQLAAALGEDIDD